MHTHAPARFHVIPFLIALALLVGVHILIGWQVALLVPLVYAFIFPSKAYMEATLQMVAAWLLLLLTSYGLAPEETSRMLNTVINIIALNSAQGLGWMMPIVSLLFAALLGFLCGVVGSGLRLALVKVPYSESGIV